MPKTPEHSTCTTVRGCDGTATHRITATGKIRGLPARASASPVNLLTCERHLPMATELTRNREDRTITGLPPAQLSLFDN